MSRLLSAIVLDPEGQVLGAAVESEGAAALDLSSDGVRRVPLEGGGTLVVRPAEDGWAWTRFARAFIHEARSPLNALAIYLDLVNTRLESPGQGGVSAAKALERAAEQVRRLEELLKTFGHLWAAPDTAADLAVVTQVAVRFATHEANRTGAKLETHLVESAFVEASARPLADALVMLLAESIDLAGEGGAVLLSVAKDDGAVFLRVSLAANPGQAFPLARRALVEAGASVVEGSQGLVAKFTAPTFGRT